MANLLYTFRGVLIVTPWLLLLLVSDMLLSFLLPLRRFFPRLAYDIASRIAASVWLSIQHIFTILNGARITISGDALPRGESAVVVCNHVAWSDFYMVQELAVRAGMLGRCRYFAKAQLKKVPFLGWGLWAMGMPLVSREWARDKGELERVFEGITRWGFPVWLVSFSEGTRFTPAKHASSRAWCASASRPQPQHLLYPRTRGFVSTVRHLRAAAPHVAAVYDLTVAYQRAGDFQRAPDMWATLSRPGLSSGGPGTYRFHVHVRRFPVGELPEGEEELAQWLEARWLEKGEWLEEKRKEWNGSVEWMEVASGKKEL